MDGLPRFIKRWEEYRYRWEDCTYLSFFTELALAGYESFFEKTHSSVSFANQWQRPIRFNTARQFIDRLFEKADYDLNEYLRMMSTSLDYEKIFQSIIRQIALAFKISCLGTRLVVWKIGIQRIERPGVLSYPVGLTHIYDVEALVRVMFYIGNSTVMKSYICSDPCIPLGSSLCQKIHHDQHEMAYYDTRHAHVPIFSSDPRHDT